jgi:lysophospholipase L1-like esterase
MTRIRLTRGAAIATASAGLVAGALLVPATGVARAIGGAQSRDLAQSASESPDPGAAQNFGRALAGRAAAQEAATYHLAWRGEDAFGHRNASARSCRFVARLEGSGTSLRVEFGDPMAGSGYSVQEAAIALVTAHDPLTVATGTSHPLTFGGHPGVRVGSRRTVLSDPLALSVPSGGLVAVSVTGSAGDAPTKAAIMEPGTCSSRPVADVGTAPTSAFGVASPVRWLTGIQVQGAAQRVAVGLGDSITEAVGTLKDGYQRWTDVLGTSGVVVINAGVSGGALSRPGMFGTDDGVSRLRTLLAEPSVTDVVIELGTNDLALGASDAQYVKALIHAISMVRAKGDRIYVGTLMPRDSKAEPFTREQDREWINTILRSHWLTQEGARLVDLDAAVRDPKHPARLRRDLDAGDGLHLNVAGEAAIGHAVAKAMGLH